MREEKMGNNLKLYSIPEKRNLPRKTTLRTGESIQVGFRSKEIFQNALFTPYGAL